jgi:Mg2+/Co2+ transporter CorB
MTPRTEIVAIDLFDPVDELKDLFVRTGYSKIVVYEIHLMISWDMYTLLICLRNQKICL